MEYNDSRPSMGAVESNARPVRSQLEKILASPGFARSERISGFLRYLVEQSIAGKSDQLKESVIGVEVFGRKPGYDPREDSVVRTEAAKLRARLGEYYSGEGSADPVIIQVPKGHYAPLILVPGEAARTQRRRRLRWMLVTAGVVALSVGAFQILRPFRASKTIAVLPFENRGAEADGDYFSDGLTDAVIEKLSLIDGLEVRSRTSSFAFKGKPRNIREAGGQLGVQYAVEGAVIRSGDRLRVHARVIQVKDDATLWSGRWDRELKDVFVIEDEISHSIANQLRLKLRAGQRRHTPNLEAHDLHLKARQLLDRGFPFDPKARQGIELLEEVLKKDAGFAPAYVDLAKAYTNWSSASVLMPPVEANPKIRAYIDKALELDPLLAEAWIFRGVDLSGDFRWAEAEQAFRRAIELNPNLADAHAYYAVHVLLRLGRWDAALREIRRSIELDPMTAAPLRIQSYILVNAGRIDEAWETFLKLKKIDPQRQDLHFHGRLLVLKGQVAEAIPYLQGEGARGWLGYAYGLLGKRAEAGQLRASESKHPNRLALICAGLQDKNCVIEALNRMADIRDPRVHWYLSYPELAIIRGDRRLDDLRKKIGL